MMKIQSPGKNGRNLWACLLAISFLFVSSAAFADDECATDDDCGADFICMSISSPCPDIACDAGPDGEGECPEPPACEEESENICVPAPPESCDVDADCDTGLVCVLYTSRGCQDTPSCPPGEEGCPELPEPDCVSETVGQCLPPYMDACEESADCGPGFECQAQEECSCTGHAPDDGEPGEDPVCECSPSGQKSCQLIEQSCSEDSECDGELVCRDLSDIIGGDMPVACDVGPDGETDCPDGGSEPAAPENYCVPADYERWLGSGSPTAPGDQEGRDEATSPEDGGDSGNDSAPNAPGSNEDDYDENTSGADADDGSSDDGCGCASTQTTTPTPGALATFVGLLLGLAGARRRIRG